MVMKAANLDSFFQLVSEHFPHMLVPILVSCLVVESLHRRFKVFIVNSIHCRLVIGEFFQRIISPFGQCCEHSHIVNTCSVAHDCFRILFMVYLFVILLLDNRICFLIRAFFIINYNFIRLTIRFI